MQKRLTIFQQKFYHITTIDLVSTDRLNKSSTNDFVKLTML